MKAGIDCGSTLIKAYWRSKGPERFVTIDGTIPSMLELSSMLMADGVKTLRLTGTGAATLLLGNFENVHATDNAIDDEIRLQALGIRHLASEVKARKLLIASVGTGISYTKVSGMKAKRSPLGNAFGGGAVLGLAQRLGVKTFDELEAAAAKGQPPDLLVKERLPETRGTPIGELILAHFGKPPTTIEDDCAGLLSCLATQIAKDVAVLTALPFSAKEVVVIGTTVARSPTLRSYLKRWEPFLKRKLHFPELGEYAAAVGAYLDLV